MRTVYFDYNATTPLDPDVREAMLPFLGDLYGNPSSVHHVGRRARAWLDEAHERAARVLGCRPSELLFTSGGTEANNLAIVGAARALRAKGRHLLTSSVEHAAVLRCFKNLAAREDFHLTLLPVGRAGVVDPNDVAGALRPDTILVSVMSANNETGIRQPIREIARLCHERGLMFHTDAVQSFGKEDAVRAAGFGADLMALCPHKFHGPKGIGLLCIRTPLQIQPLLAGGPQENDRRPGTENLAGIAGLVRAMELFLVPPIFGRSDLSPCTRLLERELTQVEGVHVIGSAASRLANTVSFAVEGTDSIALLAALDLQGICASSGSACSAGSVEPSHVLNAMGYPPALASSFVRFSLGRESTEEEAAFVASRWPELIERLRRNAGKEDVNNLPTRGNSVCE